MGDYKADIESYDRAAIIGGAATDIERAQQGAARNGNPDVWRRCFGSLDLTLLNSDDTDERVAEFVGRAVSFHSRFPGVPNVAALCVFPIFVDTAGLAAGSSGLSIAAVAGGFPYAQTYLEVKMLEVAMAVENGADEVDVVMNPGRLLSGDYAALGGEISLLKEEAGEEVVMKVILESGILESPQAICDASLLAMLAGADFIKTSTGKAVVSATVQAAAVMCRAIKAYHECTGRKVGFKVSGGVRSVDDAVLYYSVVEAILGDGWLNPGLFRIGASSLANNLLSAIEGDRVDYF